MYMNMTPNLMVENVSETIKFYNEILEFNILQSVPNKDGGLQFAILEKDKLNLMVQERRNFIEEYPTLTNEKVQPSISLYIQVEDIEKLYLKLKEKHEILKEMHKTFYGTSEFAIEDNNGYVLTFTQG
ncbi:MAG TPA: bleomycin resistance family protein [Gallicola sp.]|nr:bleomycin resistance family protein [Gallicola sp.]